MDQTQRLDWEDDEEETSAEKHRPVGNLHMFAGAHGPAQDFPIYPGPNIIGRQASCDITLPAQSVSKKHAILHVNGDCHTICDNGSLNKTRRSKVALEPEVRYALADGDFLLFADVACRYSILKKIEVPSITADESEDDSMLIPGTQATLAIEKTPGAAIRRMGCGAVLARDSGDEDAEVQKGWNDGGEGGSKDALRTSGPVAKVSFSPAGDTVVPESDEEENDTSTSVTHFPSLHLRHDRDSAFETPKRDSSFIPSSLDPLTSPPVKEPEEKESNRILQINKEELIGKQTETSSAGKNDVSDSEILEKIMEIRKDAADEGGMVVPSDASDSGLKDEGTATSHSNAHENINNLKNYEAEAEISSSSSHCIKDNKDQTSERTIAANTATENNPDSKAEEGNVKPKEKDFKVEADLCLDSDTDVDEDVPPSLTDIKKNDELETTSDKEPEQSKAGTANASVCIDRDAIVDEHKEETSDVQHGRGGDINIDSDTDVEDDTDMSKAEHDKSRTGNENASEVPKVEAIAATSASTDFDIDSDTDVEEADTTRSDNKKVDQEFGKSMEEKKKTFNLDSDTGAEGDGPASGTKLGSDDGISRTADFPLQETKDEIQLDSDTDMEEDVTVSSIDVSKEKQALSVDVQEGFHMDSDTDAEDVSSTVVTKEQGMQKAKNNLALDSDTDVDEEDQRPESSSAAVQIETATGSHTGDQQSGDVKNEKDTAGKVNKETEDLHMDSDTDVDEDDGTSVEPKTAKEPVATITGKNEAEATSKAAALQMDSDTDVDEDDGTSAGQAPKEAEEPIKTIAEKNEAEAAALHMDSDTDVDEDDETSAGQGPKKSEGPVKSSAEKNEADAAEKATALHMDSDTDMDEDDETSAGQGPKKSEGPVKSSAEKNEAKAAEKATALHMDSDTDMDEDDETSAGLRPRKVEEPVKNEAEAAALHMDSDTDVDEDDTSVVLDKSRNKDGELLSDSLSERGDGNIDTISGSSVGEITGAAEVSGGDTRTVSAESDEQETQKTDLQGADFELLATQCYLEPQEPESDLPDEEEATQAYILSSTWAEPDTFKRPSDPVGVLQISAVTLDKSGEEEDEDELAIAETQLFCLEANQTPSLSIKETPKLEEDVVDDQQEMQPTSSVQGSGKEARGPLSGAISQEDTEPVSQDFSAKLPVDTGTWLRLRRDVPASVWIKGLQQEGETSILTEDTTQDDSLQSEVDLPPLELEATQSYILEASNVQESSIKDPALLVPSEDLLKHGKSAVPLSESTCRDQIDSELSVSAAPAIEPSIPPMAPNQSPPTKSSIPEKDVLALPLTKSTPRIPETGGSVESVNESASTASNIPDTGELAVPLTEESPTEQSNIEPDESAVSATKSPPKELSNMETQVIDDDATQVCSLNLPGYDVTVPHSNLEVPSTEDATKPCGSNTEDTVQEEQSTSVTMLAVEEEKAKLAETGKGKLPSRRGLSRSRKKEQPEKSTEVSDKKNELPGQVAPENNSTPEETAESAAGELEQFGPSIVVSEAKEENEPEKGARRRGGRRKATEEPESKTKKKDELVVPAVSQKRTTRMNSETEPATSGTDELKRKQQGRKSSVKMKEEENNDEVEVKEEIGSNSEKFKENDISDVLLENHPEKEESLRLKAEDVTGPTSMEMIVGQTESDLERKSTSKSVEPTKIASASSKSSESEESRILDVPELSKTERPVRGRKAAKQKNTQEIESNNVEDQAKSKITGTDLEKQVFKMPPLKTSDSQDGGQEGPSIRRTRKSQILTAETLKEEKHQVVDTEESQTEETNKPDEQNSGKTRSSRQRRNMKEEVKEDSPTEEQDRSSRQRRNVKEGNKNSQTEEQTGSSRQRRNAKAQVVEEQTGSSRQQRNVKAQVNEEQTGSSRKLRNVKEDSKTEKQTGRLPSKRGISLGSENEKNSQQTVVENPDSSPLPKRTRKSSTEETPKSQQEVTEVEKTEDENAVRPLRRGRKSNREEQKTKDSEESLESSVTPEPQTTRRRTRRSSREQDIPDKEETVKETVTRKRRNSKAEDTELEDQNKRSVRTRRDSKEEVAEDTTTTSKDDTAGPKPSRRARRGGKADDNVGDPKPEKELSQPERSSSRTRRKASAEDSEKPPETPEASEGTKKREAEVSTQEETPKKGRPRKTLAKEEPSQVSTPVTSRKRGQAVKEDVELKRKKSDESQGAEEVPSVRRGRPRKLSTTDDSQTSAGSRESSTPEPSPSRSSRQRQGPSLSTPTDVRTPRRTGRLSSSALTTSPYVSQAGAPPKVLFTGVVDAIGEETIRALGGDIADSVFDCTHLVTDRVRRTVKFLCALGRGIPIVTLDWIDKCKKSGCFLSHTNFLVKDKEQEKNFNFVLSESLQKAKRRPLFEGYEIHVTPSVKPDPELMKDIISCSGATYLPKMPRTFKEKCVIVSCPEDAARCKSVPSRVPVTTAEFILSGILRQEVNPDAYLLSDDSEERAPAPTKRRR